MSDNNANRPVLAALAVLGAMALFGYIDNYVKVLATTGGLWQFHFLRGLIALTVLFAVARLGARRLMPLSWGAVSGRSFLTSCEMILYFGCLAFLPIAQVVAGLFTAPIWVVLFSVSFFGMKIGIWRVLAVLTGFVGTLLVIRPDIANLSLLSVLPVLAGALYALGNIATRTWCAREDTLTLLAGFFVAMMIWGALGIALLAVMPLPVAAGADGFITRGWVSPNGAFLFWTVVQGVGSLVGVGLTIRAYQMGDASFVAVFEYALLVFAAIWAFVLWQEVPDLLAMIGIALILAAGITIALRSQAPVAQA